MAQESLDALAGRASPAPASRGVTRVLVSASVGTVFEWYDFYLYASLAPVIAKKFFAGVDPRTGFIFTLLAFATGFLLRPFGALVFGRLGDRQGRKYTFLATIVVMGLSTVCVGVLPGYAELGVVAPVILIALRMTQGLALGGEFGGAATYVAESSPQNRRARNLSWIVSTGAIGLLMSLLVVALCRAVTGSAFEDWGWRLPFLFSSVLLAISVYIRLSMQESAVFARLRQEQRQSHAPIRELFGDPGHRKTMLIAFFAVCAPIAVIAYTATVYPLFFMTETLKIDAQTTNLIMMGALCTSPLMYWIFSALSDRVGRKPVMLAGYVLILATLLPAYRAMTHLGNPALERAQAQAPVVLHADPASCAIQFNPTGTRHFTSSCDVAKRLLYRFSASFATEPLAAGAQAWIGIGGQRYDVPTMSGADSAGREKALASTVSSALRTAGYPEGAEPSSVNAWGLFGLMIWMMLLQSMIYGPGTAVLVEMFPARIRYTAMSFPYHLATGWIGGLLPAGAFALSAQTGSIYGGLLYPAVWLVLGFIATVLFFRETRNNSIHH